MTTQTITTIREVLKHEPEAQTHEKAAYGHRPRRDHHSNARKEDVSMKELKLILFEKTRKALDEYTDLDAKLEEQIGIDGWGLKPKRDAAYERFCAVWEIVEAAELVDEYQAWKES